MVGKNAISLNNFEWFSHFTFILFSGSKEKGFLYDFYDFDPKRLGLWFFFLHGIWQVYMIVVFSEW